MPNNDAMVKRHEDHFIKIFNILDNIRDNYVRSPTFIISLVTIALIMSGSAGWILSKVFSDIDKNEVSIMELARQQVRLEEKQNSLEKYQDQTIVKLIDAIKH